MPHGLRHEFTRSRGRRLSRFPLCLLLRVVGVAQQLAEALEVEDVIVEEGTRDARDPRIRVRVTGILLYLREILRIGLIRSALPTVFGIRYSLSHPHVLMPTPPLDKVMFYVGAGVLRVPA